MRKMLQSHRSRVGCVCVAVVAGCAGMKFTRESSSSLALPAKGNPREIRSGAYITEKLSHGRAQVLDG